MDIFIIILALIWIVAASIQDLIKREVENWLNFSLIAIALAYRAFLSILNLNASFFLYGLLGFFIFFVLANIFYYGKIFAGGDAKLLMALGPIIPFSSSLVDNLKLFVFFIFLLLICGSFYGLVYSLALTLRNRKKFVKEFCRQIKLNKKHFICYAVLFVSFLAAVLVIQEYLLLFFPLLILIFPFLISYARAVEEACMIVKLPALRLTEGDWLYKDLKVGKKKIKANWQGLSREEIKLIKKYMKNKKIEIKQGIPFVPSFFIAFILLVLLWESFFENIFWFF